MSKLIQIDLFGNEVKKPIKKQQIKKKRKHKYTKEENKDYFEAHRYFKWCKFGSTTIEDCAKVCNTNPKRVYKLLRFYFPFLFISD